MLAKRKLPHCSQSACTAMVKLAKNTDLSEFPNTRMSYRWARSATLGDTTSGPMIKTVPLTSTPPHANRDMHVVNPWAYLHTAFNNGGGFFDLIKSRLAAEPCSPEKPWALCLYSDEVVPGHQLAAHNARKVWAIYFSFLELHPHLSNERAWCPLAAEPSSGLKTFSAGISQVFRQIIKLFFLVTSLTCAAASA